MDVQAKGNEATRASLELLYNVSRELAAALDLRTVLQRVLLLSAHNVGASSGSIIVLDDSSQPVEGAILVQDKIHDHTARQLRVTYEHGLAGWVARKGQAVLIPDTSQDDRWLRRPDDAANRTGPKSAVSAPILVRDRLVGVMTLVHPTPGLFASEHLELVQAIADQAGIAVLNARLYAESQRQARVMTALAESSAAITASLDLDEVLQQILDQASQALRVEVASLALLDEGNGSLEFRATTSKATAGIIGMHLPIGQGVAGWVAREGRGVIVPNAYQDTRFFPEFDRFLDFETRAIACAPIRSRDQLIGVIEAINPVDGAFDNDALLVLMGIGSLAGTAIGHAQLFESLEVAHQRYRELFEDSIDPILITDWNGSILEANRPAEACTGLGSEALRKKAIREVHVVEMEKLGPGFGKLVSGNTVTYESIVRTEGGRETPVQVYVRRVHTDNVSRLQWILRDITERKNLDSLREDLISMIYHDLRSPLSNIVSSLDVLASTFPTESDPAFKSLLNIAIRSTERIQRLTNSLLDINRLEAGQPVGNRQPVSLPPMIKDSVDAVQPLTLGKDIRIALDIPSDLPAVLVDGDMIRRVLINLIENAIKFSSPHGKVIIGAQGEDRFVRIWVDDYGPGIPHSERERIFDKFTRLHTKDGPRGFGLGLAYCRLAVNGHGGDIWVESEMGSGSRFIFTLPVAVSPNAAETS